MDKCGCNGTKTEIIDKMFGIVIETDDGFEIVTDEKGLLLPCSEIPASFKNGSQPVSISGTLKKSCKKILYDFDLTPIQISELKLRNSTYDKSDITLTVIKSEDYGYTPGFGYFVEDQVSGLKLLQPHIPAVSGIVPFKTPEDATKTALLAIHLLRKNPGQLPSLSLEILRYINIIN
jgi:hypothetical protein